jgi:hypothetical protein
MFVMQRTACTHAQCTGGVGHAEQYTLTKVLLLLLLLLLLSCRQCPVPRAQRREQRFGQGSRTSWPGPDCCAGAQRHAKERRRCKYHTRMASSVPVGVSKSQQGHIHPHGLHHPTPLPTGCF